jgi:2-iminobutanoate/2-iminopropanoate deaminase
MRTPHFSPWKEAAPLIFISGQLAFDANGQISAEDIAGQTLQVLRNLDAVLKGAALELRDVVKTTVWLRNVGDFAAFDESYARFFGEVKPARSTVVSALVHPKALIEIEAIAGKILT